MEDSMAKKPKRRGRGRPNTRGETVQVGFRLSKDIDKALEQLRRRALESLSKTQALEKVIRAGLEAMKRSTPRDRR